MAENQQMVRLFRSSGYRLTREADGGVFTIEFPIEYSVEAREAEWEHEKRATTASMMPLLYPKSIALIGASRNERSIGGRLLRNLLNQGFSGPVYPVNPSASFVSAVKAFPSITDVPDHVDLAIIAVPAQHVLQAVEDCGAKGVRSIVVITAGFREVGLDDVERSLVGAARFHGMRMVGPNCMGIVNTDPAVAPRRAVRARRPRRAATWRWAASSGAIGLAILDEATELGVGISTFVLAGQRRRRERQRSPAVLGGRPGDRCHPALHGVVRPSASVRALSPAASAAGSRSWSSSRASRRVGGCAAGSHTGSLASLDVAVDALFRQSGVVRTDSLDQLFDVTKLLAHQPLPQGRRVAVISNAGGPAILIADALEIEGLELPQLSDELQSRLGEHLLDTASTTNPIDMVASAGPDEYEACLHELMQSDEIDTVIVLHIPTTPDGAGEVIEAIRRGLGDPAADDKTALGGADGVRW